MQPLELLRSVPYWKESEHVSLLCALRKFSMANEYIDVQYDIQISIYWEVGRCNSICQVLSQLIITTDLPTYHCYLKKKKWTQKSQSWSVGFDVKTSFTSKTCLPRHQFSSCSINNLFSYVFYVSPKNSRRRTSKCLCAVRAVSFFNLFLYFNC